VGRNYQVIQGTNRLHGVQVLDVLFFLSNSFIDNSSVIFSTAQKKKKKVHQDNSRLTMNFTFWKSVKDARINGTQPIFSLLLWKKCSMSIQSIKRER
jgi:hypothetical protein